MKLHLNITGLEPGDELVIRRRGELVAIDSTADLLDETEDDRSSVKLKALPLAKCGAEKRAARKASGE